jgi:NAD+ kinase
MTDIAVVGRLGGMVNASSETIGLRLLKFIGMVINSGHRAVVDADTFQNFKLEPHPNLIHAGTLEYMFSGQMDSGPGTPEMCVVFGGDGTMLHVTKLIAQLSKKKIPVLGVNHGRVGFITDMDGESKSSTILQELLTGTHEKRSLLESTILGKSPVTLKILPLALNDVLINRANGKILQFCVTIDDSVAYTTRADGLMVATPTGSTAYAMSAGGPIIKPSANVFEILPMIPQTMSYRPLLVDNTTIIKVQLLSGVARVYVDGADLGQLQEGESIKIAKAKRFATLVHPSTYDYYETLRTKLNWHLEPGK